jgi:hypothetical protein
VLRPAFILIGRCWSTIHFQYPSEAEAFYDFYFCYLFFYSAGVWTQGLTLARQMFFHLSTPPTLFLWWVFSRQDLRNYLPRLASNQDHLDLCPASWMPRITGMSHWYPAMKPFITEINIHSDPGCYFPSVMGISFVAQRYGFHMKCPPQTHALSTWSLADGEIWGGAVTFRQWD